MIKIYVLVFLISYLIGSIPTGYWFCKFFFNLDITKHGSKNIGATNVARVLGFKTYFFLIFLLDFFKAFVVLWGAGYFVKNLFIVAVVLLIGNAYSVFLKFRGGKGVATLLGILAFLDVTLFLIFVITWLLILFLTKWVAVASMLACYVVTLISYVIVYHMFFFLLFISVWIMFRHKENIMKFIQLRN
jgi:glycerol-3-phosphate acyltransferase PlsY